MSAVDTDNRTVYRRAFKRACAVDCETTADIDASSGTAFDFKSICARDIELILRAVADCNNRSRNVGNVEIVNREVGIVGCRRNDDFTELSIGISRKSYRLRCRDCDS